MSLQLSMFDHANSAVINNSFLRSGSLKTRRRGLCCSGSVKQWINAPLGLMFFTSPPMHPSAVMTMAGQSTAVLRWERLSSKFIMGACPAMFPSKPLK
jgi:hypothetical protein